MGAVPKTPPTNQMDEQKEKERDGAPIDLIDNVVTLSAINTEAAGAILALPHGSSMIGRALTCDLFLLHPSVSRQHCSLVVSQVGIEVQDECSTHGTRVNGRLVQTAKLQSGDHLQLGHVILEVEVRSRRDLAGQPAVQYPGDHLKYIEQSEFSNQHGVPHRATQPTRQVPRPMAHTPPTHRAPAPGHDASPPAPASPDVG